MNRTPVILLAALEALITVVIGVSLALVPLTLLWAIEYGFAGEWIIFWRAAADTWLLGNGVNLAIAFPPDLVAQLGIAGAAEPFFVTLAPLGFSVLTVVLGIRAGGRAARTDHWVVSSIVSVLFFAALATLVTVSALNGVARPSIVQGALIPAAVYALGLAIGILRSKSTDSDLIPVRVASWRISEHQRGVIVAALRGGFAAATMIVGAAAVLLTAAIFLNYATIVGLYEAGQPSVMGATMTTLAQAAFVPNAVIWNASWLIGPGFALGAGSSVSPVNTVVGPIPQVPLLGAVPSGDFVFGFVGLLVPLLSGFVAAVLVRHQLRTVIGARFSASWIATGALGIGIVGGGALGVLAWWSQGAAGPGRLAEVGPNPWLVALFATIEIAIAASIGLASGSSDTSSSGSTGRDVARPGSGERMPPVAR